MKPKDIKMAEDSMTYIRKNLRVSDWTDVKPTEKSHKEILEWANERRPYSPSDLINVCRTKGLFPRLDIEKGR